MSTASDKPDLLIRAAHSRPAREVYGVSFCVGAWWFLIALRCLMPLAGEHWMSRTAAIIAAPMLGWLALLLLMVTCGALASLGCTWLKLGNSVLRSVSSMLFCIVCSAIALRLLFSESASDRVLGALWGMGLLICLSQQMLRKIGSTRG